LPDYGLRIRGNIKENGRLRFATGKNTKEGAQGGRPHIVRREDHIMSHIRNRKHSLNRYVAALAMVAIPAAANAQPPRDHDRDRDDHDKPSREVVVKGERKKVELSSPKYTQPLVDTPKTITVISKGIIQEQGATTLMDALRNTPGITMQLGENGNTSSGDTFQMRGFSAQSSLFLDGIRDLGAVTRDTFNIEQIEVAKGPSGSDGGRGSSAGFINLVSKLPGLRDASSAQFNATTEGGLRGALDFNHRIGRSSALRLNVFTQDNDVPGRGIVNNSGYGIAPAFGIGLGTPTRFYAFAQYVKQDNTPDGGLPTIGYKGFYSATAQVKAGAKVDRENYYGSVHDFEDTEATMLTTKVEHDFGDHTVVTNTSRYGKTSMDRILTGVNAITAPNVNDPSTWTLSRSRQGVDQTNEILANQTNIVTTFLTGGIKHDLSAGMEVMYESQRNDTLAVPTTVPAIVVPAANLYHPDPNITLPVPVRSGAYTDGHMTTVALYAFDTLKLNEQWLLNAGFRADTYRVESTAVTAALVADNISDDDTVISWNVGAVFKPLPNGSLYASVANSVTPPGGNNFALSRSTTSTANPGFDPQKTLNYELGTKWDLLNKNLSVTAAYYRTEHENELALTDPLVPTSVVQGGKRIVEGFEFSAIGKLSEKWSVSAGIATMDTSVEEGAATGNNAAGAVARWSPDLTGTLWTTYKATRKLTIGGGARYTSEQKRVVDPAAVIATQNTPEIPAYWVVDAMASYDFSRDVALRVNIYNVTDKDYISTLNNGGSRIVLGTPRYATASLVYKF
jgi:catecholate siderophore receptor